ncbi:MAG: tRNA lysidine(34) synthetase TilS [Erysipelotrichaceae bacterium]|nr:tRNA lysidine(34) synthetase TilS [Erysipelotrichaceae bacterium]
MNYQLDLDRNKRYLLGVSGGCDSMMLLSLCVREKLDIAVCFCNYRLRETADLEEKIVEQYCRENNVRLFRLYPKQETNENFQMWAREARYEFYKKIYDQLECDYLLTGHQKDDSLENYLMSEERGSHGWYYGIPYEGYHHGMKILRPLLKYRKKDTRQYCEEYNVPYHDDESNFTDHYTRNRIRHSLIEPADDAQIEKWASEIERLNKVQKRMLERFEKEYGEEISISVFRKDPDVNDLMRWMLWQKDSTASYSSQHIDEIVKTVISSKRNGFIPLNNGLEVVYEYGVVYVHKPGNSYSYVLDEVRYFRTPYFEIKAVGKTIEGLSVSEADFPLMIRNGREDDVIELRYGHKKLSRFFIDRKIKRKDRFSWPVVENREGIVVFIANIGCNKSHFTTKPDLFMLKF